MKQNVFRATSPESTSPKAAPVGRRQCQVIPSIYDALVFSSGGSRGIAHLGALAELEQRYDLSKTRCFVGTSSGAIAACVACLGLRARDVFDACVVPFQYEKQLTLHLLTQKFGLDSGESLSKFIASIVPDALTFRDVYMESGHVLSIIGTNITKSSIAIFDPIRTPDMSIRDALRISCSIPLLFTAVERDGDVFVDGAMTSAFPVSVATDVYGCTRILGLNFEEYGDTVSGKTMTFEDFISTLVDTVIYSNSKRLASYHNKNVTVDVCTMKMSPGITGLVLDLTEDQKRDMYDAGMSSMRIFLQKQLGTITNIQK